MPLTPVIIPQVQATSSTIVFVALLTFSLPGRDSLRVCNNSVDVVSRGQTFTAFPFQIVLPNDDSEKLPTVSLKIANVSGEIMDFIRGLPEAPNLLLEIVTDVDFDVVEKSVGFLTMNVIGYNALDITGSLTVENILSRRFPAGDYSPVEFPALFMT
jgi:hypothetical protein